MKTNCKIARAIAWIKNEPGYTERTPWRIEEKKVIESAASLGLGLIGYEDSPAVMQTGKHKLKFERL